MRECLTRWVATEELLNQWLFEKEKGRGDSGDEGRGTVGFALFFHKFLHLPGRAALSEDLYVRPEYRGQGFGTAF